VAAQEAAQATKADLAKRQADLDVREAEVARRELVVGERERKWAAFKADLNGKIAKIEAGV